MESQRIIVSAEQAEQTVAALLRSLLPDQSWSQVRRLVETRRVKIGRDLCLDPARRVHVGEVFEFLARPAAPPKEREAVVVRHLDEHLIVVEKPSGVSTVRHPSERAWDARRKALSPTLE